MNVFERFIASECPPENGSVLWVNTSKTPITLNMQLGGQWQVLGAFYDAEILNKILDELGNFNPSSDDTVKTMLTDIINRLDDEATAEEINAMFVRPT